MQNQSVDYCYKNRFLNIICLRWSPKISYLRIPILNIIQWKSSNNIFPYQPKSRKYQKNSCDHSGRFSKSLKNWRNLDLLFDVIILWLTEIPHGLICCDGRQNWRRGNAPLAGRQLFISFLLSRGWVSAKINRI